MSEHIVWVRERDDTLGEREFLNYELCNLCNSGNKWIYWKKALQNPIFE